jgi:hypothetical protein
MRTVRQGCDDNTVKRLSRREIWFHKGQASFRQNGPMPVNAWPDDEWHKLNDGQCFWLGYMFARAKDILRKENVRKYIENGEDLPPNLA